MKKVFTGVLGLVLVVGLVAGSAVALFTDEVTISGAEVQVATAGLELDAFGNFDGVPGKEFYSSRPDYDKKNLPLDGLLVKPLYPGQTDWGHIIFINTSTAGMGLNLSAQLTGVTNDDAWAALKDVIQMRVVRVTSTTDDAQHGATSWFTLQQWANSARALPDSPLAGDSEQHFWVEVRLPADADDLLQGMKVSGMTFTVTGTQANDL